MIQRQALAELRGGNFDRDVAIQTRIVRAIHFARPTFADECKDFLRTEFVAYRKRHNCDSAKCSPPESE